MADGGLVFWAGLLFVVVFILDELVLVCLFLESVFRAFRTCIDWMPFLWGVWFLFGEFDPGSGRTLAACLTHASRTMKP